MEKEDFWTKQSTMLWRYFKCIFCGDMKKKYMAQEREYKEHEKRSVDHRQRCSVCNKITPHEEISPPQQS